MSARLTFTVAVEPDGGVRGHAVVKAAIAQTWTESARRALVAVVSRPEHRRATRRQRESIERREIYARGVVMGWNAARAFLQETTAEPAAEPAPPIATAPPPPVPPTVLAPPLTPDPMPCDACNGSALVLAPDGGLVDCARCAGTGRAP